MNKATLDLIEQLTKLDTKSLSQKALKLSEECGEVSKSVLPYESAHGTLHRFVHKDKIAEECVDVMLVALSMAYSLGFSNNDITSIMTKKAMYWSTLQQNEENVDSSKIPHELHLTVSNVTSIEHFKETCAEIGVKPILLALHCEGGEFRDIMTSSVYVGDTVGVQLKMHSIKTHLELHGYNVIREKIEAPPFHPCVPTIKNGVKNSPNNYLESHIEVYVTSEHATSLQRLREIVRDAGLHVSRNLLKATNEVSTVMLTYRNYTDTIERFRESVKSKRDMLENSGYTINGKEIVEYCLYDTNISQDKAWVTAHAST